MRAVRATLRAAFAEAWANRGGFWTQMAIMVANDVVWVFFWVVFFREVGSLRGWDTDSVLLLLAVLTTAAGLVLGLLGNARRIGTLITEGSLDAALALPVAPLAHLLTRRVEPINLGDVAFGITLFAVAGNPTPSRIAVFVVGCAVAAIVYAGFLVAIGSLAFFSGRSESGELGFHAITLLASYPVDVFAGPAKALLYTLVPAAFVSTVPARLVDDLDPWLALSALAMAATFAAAGVLAFRLGVRRYASGSGWTRA